jgi:hypothetical protein
MPVHPTKAVCIYQSSLKNAHINAYHVLNITAYTQQCHQAICAFQEEELPTTSMHHPRGPLTSTPIVYNALSDE